MREVGAGQTTKESLWNLAKENEATIICVGNHGRKGPKKEETVLGTQIEYLSENSTFPVMIVKDRKRRDEKRDKCLRYAVCFDDSDYAKKALALTLSLMRVEDKLTIVTVREFDMSESQLDEKVRGEADKHNVTKLEIVVLEKQPNKRT